MSQWAADPDLVQRRLATLVALLEKELKRTVPHGQLTPKEMVEWAHQCRNIMGVATRPSRKADKRIEDLSDEELLS